MNKEINKDAKRNKLLKKKKKKIVVNLDSSSSDENGFVQMREKNDESDKNKNKKHSRNDVQEI